MSGNVFLSSIDIDLLRVRPRGSRSPLIRTGYNSGRVCIYEIDVESSMWYGELEGEEEAKTVDDEVLGVGGI